MLHTTVTVGNSQDLVQATFSLYLEMSKKIAKIMICKVSTLRGVSMKQITGVDEFV